LRILEKQLENEDPIAMRAAAILLRLAGPARIPRGSSEGGGDPDESPTGAEQYQRDQSFWDEMDAYIHAPPPGQSGAP
jgi:hypothetical protein